MTPGKAASQAGHAFLDSYITAPKSLIDAYNDDGGTKVVLTCPDEKALCQLYYNARMAKLPCGLVVESEHVMPPVFDGSPIVTAVGIGPVPRSLARSITKGLPLMK